VDINLDERGKYRRMLAGSLNNNANGHAASEDELIQVPAGVAVPDSAPRSTDRFLKRAFSGFGVRRLAAAFSPLCRSGLWPVPSSSFSRHSPLRGPP